MLHRRSPAAASRGFCVAAVPELCVVAAALVTARAPGHGATGAVACGLEAHGAFLDQGSNRSPLHWQAASQPLDQQGGPLTPTLAASSSFSARQPRQPGSAAPLLGGLGIMLGSGSTLRGSPQPPGPRRSALCLAFRPSLLASFLFAHLHHRILVPQASGCFRSIRK